MRERFTPEVLDEYLRALGIRMFDESFYAPDRRATLIEKRGRPAGEANEHPIPACSDVSAPG